jgi:glycosyl transferase, family 25
MSFSQGVIASTIEQNPATESAVCEPEWGFFDRIYCISLSQRHDRRAQAQAQFRRVGLAERVEFLIVEKHATDTEQGIFDSHLQCMRRGLDAGASTILIFEDDVLFERFSPPVLRRAIQFMKSDADWRLFFFGCFVSASRKTGHESVLKVRYLCTTHAYAVSRSFAQKLVEMPWQGVAYDDTLRDLQGDGYYAAYPALAYQSNARTDNDKMAALDRRRRWLGGMRRLQRWNELNHHRPRLVITAHVLAALTLATLILTMTLMFAGAHGR